MLAGKNINLRLIREEDLPFILEHEQNLEERGPYLPVGVPSELKFKKRYAETSFWEEHYGKLLITDKAGRILGDICFFRDSQHWEGYEIGYQIYDPKDRGKGYTAEAVRLFSAYLFALKPIVRLQIGVFKGNIPSRRVAEKCGYVLDGTIRKAFFARGKYFDLEILTLLREECPTLEEVQK